ncbi:MAG: hypothetical protein QOG76_8436 [Pseudonocardiales bacterium]|nr:hypothetical protein [Pseudonocardiales bacterium]
MTYLPVAMSSRTWSSAPRFSVAVMASAVSAGVHPALDARPGDPRSLKKFGVRPDVRAPLAGRVVFVEDRLDRAHRLACATVHTLARIDVQHPAACVDAVDRAFLDARPVQYVHARLSDHVGHRTHLRAPWTPHIGSGQSVHTDRSRRPGTRATLIPALLSIHPQRGFSLERPALRSALTPRERSDRRAGDPDRP